LWLGEDGTGFIHAVNFLQSLPYLFVIEIVLLAVPIGIHLFLGVQYLFEAKMNSWPTNGASPSLGKLTRNHAFTWQRITSIVLVIGVIAHVVTMRIMRYPEKVGKGLHTEFIVTVDEDPGLEAAVTRLDGRVSDGKVIVPDFGRAVLFTVRDSFQHIWICVLYSIFVAAAAFHAGNGLWTFLISWGVTLNEQGRRMARAVSTFLMIVLALCGFASIWLTYWVNLYR
jgi:succinate dehydrogenase / fumarate reductase cytochrome b subunit